MPLRSAIGDAEKVAREIQAEVKEVLFETDAEGVVVKADTLGSLEALIVLLRSSNIKIKSASVGSINKKDIAGAQVAASLNPFYSVVLGFNVEVLPEADELAEKHGIKIIVHDVIYHIIDDFTTWKDGKKKAIEMAELDELVRGAKFRILPGHTFRQSNPAVVGIEVLSGRLCAGDPIMNAAGKKLTVVKELQEHNEAITSVEAGKQVALSMDKVMVGRQINEGDVLYTDVPDTDFRKMKELKHYLNKADVGLLKEIAEIKRKENPTWGI
jgi:translation initiation factor 5B